MNVIVFASRKGGSGKSTLAAHIASYAHRSSRHCLLIDTDPQGSLALWHGLRSTGELALKLAARGVAGLIDAARREKIEWVFIDTPPNLSAVVTDAIRYATLVVIPTRPAIFDVTSVKETIDCSRQLRKPYVVIMNGAPSRREGVDSPLVVTARENLALLRAPVWGGQITNRANLMLALAEGQGAKEYSPDSHAGDEIGRLWLAIQKSVRVIRGEGSVASAMHRRVA